MGPYKIFVVRMTGIEPARPFGHEGLNLARLPSYATYAYLLGLLVVPSCE